jgi:peptidoglycan/xylan/chitin deacetylase (PgdA/CDA1 family)
MRKQVGILVAGLFYYSGLVGISRWFMQHSGKRLIILNYHHASGGDLRRHMLYLRRHYRVLHLEEALEELYRPCAARNASRDQRTRLVLTFDDGYYDNVTYAFPLACKLQTPITIFLIPGYVEHGDYFWWGEGQRLVRRATIADVELGGYTFHLNNSRERAALSRVIDSRLRRAPSVADRERALAEFRDMLWVPSTVTEEEKADRPLNWAEISQMHESGWVSFGAHTMHHPVLSYLADPLEVRREVKQCRHVLEQQLGHPVRTFAYPIGRSEHIGEEAVQAVKEHA